jgi:hypothetical protein
MIDPAMRRTTIVVGFAFGGAGIVSCSLLVDTSGLSDATGQSDASARDAPATPEGGTQAFDAATDASAPDADAALPCVGAGWFCDDFEGTLGAKWTSNEVNGGTVTRVSDAKSGAFAMQAQVDADGGTRYANLILALPTVLSRIACELDLKVTVLPTSGELGVIYSVAKTTVGIQRLYVGYGNGTWSVNEYTDQGGTNVLQRSQPSPLGPVTGQWTHLRFETDFATVSMTIDGMTAQTLTGITPVSASSHHLALGLPAASTPEAAAVLIDDLVCAFTP